jgi:hypothetical protein
MHEVETSNQLNESPVADQGASIAATFGVVVALGALFAASVFYARAIYAACDDTYIYLVYVKNLFEGNGLTFNGMKVQGFTSVLWVAFIAAGRLMTEALPAVPERMSMASGLFVIVMAYLLGRRVGLSRVRSLIVPALLAGTGDFAFYMSNGIETIFFAGMVLLALQFVYAADARKTLRSFILPLVLALTIFARPEGALVAATVIAFLAWRARTLAVGRCLLWLAIMIVPVVLVARIYYGSFLPNTYHAKAGAGLANTGQGLLYLMHFIKAKVVVVLALVYLAAHRRKVMGPAAAPLFVVILIYIVNLTIKGGDNLVGHRAFLPVLPVIYLTVVAGFRHLNKAVVFAALVVVSAFHVANYNYGTIVGGSFQMPVREQIALWRTGFIRRQATGLYLKENYPSDTVVALNAAGIIPYYSGMSTIDMLGLNNKYIATHGRRDRSLAYGHQAGDGHWVIRRRPDVILFGGLGRAKTAYFLSDREIWRNSDFRKFYRPREFPENVRPYVRDPEAVKQFGDPRR